MKTINLHRVLAAAALSVLLQGAAAQQITTKHPIVDLGRVIYRQPVTADFQLRNSSRSDITITRRTRSKSAPMREFSAVYTGTVPMSISGYSWTETRAEGVPLRYVPLQEFP